MAFCNNGWSVNTFSKTYFSWQTRFLWSACFDTLLKVSNCKKFLVKKFSSMLLPAPGYFTRFIRIKIKSPTQKPKKAFTYSSNKTLRMFQTLFQPHFQTLIIFNTMKSVLYRISINKYLLCSFNMTGKSEIKVPRILEQ